ncbi:hypothetical protein HUU53_04915 [Candidatus Micrarchaeota archaeon]|nr:hypothetical protein [Candidatus Micrarchaeota archaeon]
MTICIAQIIDSTAQCLTAQVNVDLTLASFPIVLTILGILTLYFGKIVNAGKIYTQGKFNEYFQGTAYIITVILFPFSLLLSIEEIFKYSIQISETWILFIFLTISLLCVLSVKKYYENSSSSWRSIYMWLTENHGYNALFVFILNFLILATLNPIFNNNDPLVYKTVYFSLLLATLSLNAIIYGLERERKIYFNGKLCTLLKFDGKFFHLKLDQPTKIYLIPKEKMKEIVSETYDG